MTDMAVLLTFRSCIKIKLWSQTSTCLTLHQQERRDVLFVESGGSELDIGTPVSKNLAAGARLAAENKSQPLVKNMVRTYELRLTALEKFVWENGDDAILFGQTRDCFLQQPFKLFCASISIIFVYFIAYAALAIISQLENWYQV